MQIVTIHQRVEELRKSFEKEPFADLTNVVVAAAQYRTLGFEADEKTVTGIHGSDVYTNFSSSLGFTPATLMSKIGSLGLLEKVQKIVEYPNGLKVIWNESGPGAPALCRAQFFKEREAAVSRIISDL